MEVKRNDVIINRCIVVDDIVCFVWSDWDKNLYFYIIIFLLEDENSFNFYDDVFCKFVIEGRGGRENVLELEMLELRIMLKIFDSIINKIFNVINLKLWKDIGYGSLIIKGNYKVFYNKVDLGKKKFVYDIYNFLLLIIEIENNED